MSAGFEAYEDKLPSSPLYLMLKAALIQIILS